MSELTQVAVEIEEHVAFGGWDQKPRLYALVETGDLMAREPMLADKLGLDPGSPLTPVEQEDLEQIPLDELLARVAWPPEVSGCAVVQEVVVLPPGAEVDQDHLDVTTWANSHPERREVRLSVAVLRDGTTGCALRLRARPGVDDEHDEVVVGDDLAPNLTKALLATLED